LPGAARSVAWCATGPWDEANLPVVEAKVEIEATAADVFDLAQDYDLRLRWDPFLREMRFRNGAVEAAPGVVVWVRANNGLSMEVVYITLDRPRSVAMKMTRGPVFFERFAGTWRFEQVGDDRTLVTFRYNFETRWPWLRSLSNALIARVFERDLEQRLRGLKRGAEQTDLLRELHAKRTDAGAAR
jgi:ribosome-associated toxin RatA of RatAB toxin-antitoxin module